MPAYCYIWRYTVHPDRIDDFIAAYNADGPWARLFKRARGYQRTELHRDRTDHTRFITIDYWNSVNDWQAFRVAHADDFEALDAQCEQLTIDEHEIGQYDAM